MRPNYFFERKLVVFVIFLLAIVLETIPAAASTKYSFNFVYNDGSGDFYSGYVYGPDGIVQVSSTISNQPSNMGGAAIAGGYYTITGADSGYESVYDGQEYITTYYDADTKKYSYTLYENSGLTQSTSDQNLFVGDRRYTAESGYVYDPSVPDTDAYFGNSDVCYSFSTSSNSANFLAYYITDLPYWNQPSTYQNSCSMVAGAEVLAYWDKHYGDYLLLSSYDANWETDWPDNTSNSPSSYVSLIGTLGTDMYWTAANGTYGVNQGPGLVKFCSQQGYSSDFVSTYDVLDNSSARSSAWDSLVAAMTPSSYYPVFPEIVGLAYGNGNNHTAVARGYWNDGYVCVDMGYGTGSTNEKFNWNKTTDISGSDAYISGMIEFYYYVGPYG